VHVTRLIPGASVLRKLRKCKAVAGSLDEASYLHTDPILFPPPSTAVMTSTIGIPIKLLNEASVSAYLQVNPHSTLANYELQGHIVTIEISNGQIYRGKLLEGTRKPTEPFPKIRREN
jgi:hypothetical protein